MFRRNEPGDAALDAYCKEIGEEFCPYLLPALKRDCVLFSLYQLEEGDEEKLSETVFYLALIHTELLRAARRAISDLSARELLCENVLVTAQAARKADILAWPHWLLKLLYTKSKLMFGKFRPGAAEPARSGVSLPLPPYFLLSVRSAIPDRDKTFFTKAPQLSPVLLSAADSSDQPIRNAVCHDRSKVLDSLEELSPETITQEKVLALVSSLRSDHIYGQVKQWARDEETRLGDLASAANNPV